MVPVNKAVESEAVTPPEANQYQQGSWVLCTLKYAI